VAADVARPQPHTQEHSGAALKDQQRLIHALLLETVEQRQLLVAVAGIIGRVDVEGDLSALEIGGKLLIMIEIEGELSITLCHLQASLVAGAGSVFAPVLPAQEARFTFGNQKRAA